MHERYLTPHKLGVPVLTGSGVSGAFDERCVDCPFVFWHRGEYHMMYVGFDGIGYQTALATSMDLIRWNFKGMLLKRGAPGRWDSGGAAGTSILRASYDMGALPVLKKHDGKYWMIYHSYPGEGYEAGPAQMGLAWTEDEELLNWHRLEEPVFTWKDGQGWDRGGLYKAWLLEHRSTFYLYYNAKDKDEPGWVEQTGLAISADMRHWKRHEGNPVLPVTPGAWDSRFASDPVVLRDGGRWVMFYFGFDSHHAQEGVAFSDDLIHWTKHPEPIIRAGRGNEIDATHAHKPAVLLHGGVLYHFYCAVRPWQPGDITKNGGEFRCITVATSVPVHASISGIQ